MRHTPVFGMLLLAACASSTIDVRGRVVDQDGRPIPGAVVCATPFPSMSAIPSPPGVVTGAEGEFEGEFINHSGGVKVMAVDRGRMRGGLARSRRGEPVEIVATPLGRVMGRVSYDKIPKTIREGSGARFSSIYIGKRSLFQDTMPLVGIMDWEAGGALEDGTFEFLLPPGKYNVLVHGAHQWIQREVTVPEALKEVDLGVMEAEPFPGQEIYGTAAPELRFADARGIVKEGGLAALKGKWVLVYFWDHRMAFNTHWLPALISFYKEHPELRDRMEVVGVHNCDDVQTVDDLDRARTWKTGVADFEAIPFPVGIDDGEKTFNAYGLVRGSRRRSPRHFLITPEGIVDFNPTVVNFTLLLKSKLGVN
jgi:peroxiredoxin